MIILEDIIHFAKSAHNGQFRRDGVTPYIEHVRQVAQRVQGDEEAEMVAWLHDVVEDTGVNYIDLKAIGVPQDVIDAVQLLTHINNEPYMEYLEKIKVNPLATKVKIADMLSNLSDSPTHRQIRKYAEGLLFLTEG